MESYITLIKDRIKDNEQKVIVSAKSAKQFSTTSGLKHAGYLDGEVYAKGDYQGYHKAVAKTKTVRMLKQYEKYNEIWNRDIERSAASRDAIDGKVNQR